MVCPRHVPIFIIFLARLMRTEILPICSLIVTHLNLEHSEPESASIMQSHAGAAQEPPPAGRKAKRMLSSKKSSPHQAVVGAHQAVVGAHHPSVIWDGIVPQCGHPIHKKCALRQLEQLPQPGDRFMTRAASCGMCRAQFKHHSLTRTLEPFQSRFMALLAKLKEENDALPADLIADMASMTPDDFLARHVFMLCTGCQETCYAGLHQCMAADEGESPAAEAPPASSRSGDACDKGGWRCVACLNPNPKFPVCCSNPEHGENFIAFKCFYCCDVRTSLPRPPPVYRFRRGYLTYTLLKVATFKCNGSSGTFAPFSFVASFSLKLPAHPRLLCAMSHPLSNP